MWPTIVFPYLYLIVSTSSASATVSAAAALQSVLSTNQLNIDNFNKNLYNFTDIINHINGVLKSLNLSDIEVNIILNRIDSQQLNANFSSDIDSDIDIDSYEFEKSLTYLFKTTLETDWFMKDLLQEIVTVSSNIKVPEIFYVVLWQELKQSHNKMNPFSYIELYKNIQSILMSHTSDKLQRLQSELEIDIVQHSVQVLQSYFIHNTTFEILLNELRNFKNLYQIAIPHVLENINSIESKWLLANDLLGFDAQTDEAVYNHITYIKYLKTLNEDVPLALYHNLEVLIARPDFVNISAEQRQVLSKSLPLSMGNLFAVQKVCLRNTTTNFYLYECPQTYLMCTNLIENNQDAINRKKATFEIERIGGNHEYTLRSPYWLRYLRLQTNNSKNTTTTSIAANNTTTISKITKNLYSHSKPSSWLIEFQGNYATIQDPTRTFYVCGGDALYWSNTENYAYTRNSNDFLDKQNQCLWLLEDCSDVE